ncbi:hypothetical protein [Burkholderia ubonensis]|uniref:hypothetical protein n=1 Tax=Burkholderia ubonensis TaxID=101571 RepID=UPI000B0EA98C|nr:hypothetical protein [Burkholderia ubonensis]
MTESQFPHHAGGVLQVQHSVRWGAVPEALLEDPQLDLDSRAVAAWLAVKPGGWQISISALRRRLGRMVPRQAGRQEYRELGKDRWQRIAVELESAGYLRRHRQNGAAGQWLWCIVFNPTPQQTKLTATTTAGFAGDGEASSGLAGAGEPSHKGIPRERNTNVETTITGASAPPADRSTAPAAAVAQPPGDVVVDKWAEPHREMLMQALSQAQVNGEVAQQIVDEFAGVLEAASLGKHRGIKSNRAWLKHVIELSKTGEFVPEFGRSVKVRRQRQSARGAEIDTVPAYTAPDVARAKLAQVRRLIK